MSDDGIGFPTGHDAPKAGLGTGIVEAPARNLHGTLAVSDAGPGTIVTVRHRAASNLQTHLPAAE